MKVLDDVSFPTKDSSIKNYAVKIRGLLLLLFLHAFCKHGFDTISFSILYERYPSFGVLSLNQSYFVQMGAMLLGALLGMRTLHYKQIAMGGVVVQLFSLIVFYFSSTVDLASLAFYAFYFGYGLLHISLLSLLIEKMALVHQKISSSLILAILMIELGAMLGVLTLGYLYENIDYSFGILSLTIILQFVALVNLKIQAFVVNEKNKSKQWSWRLLSLSVFLFLGYILAYNLGVYNGFTDNGAIGKWLSFEDEAYNLIWGGIIEGSAYFGIGVVLYFVLRKRTSTIYQQFVFIFIIGLIALSHKYFLAESSYLAIDIFVFILVTIASIFVNIVDVRILIQNVPIRFFGLAYVILLFLSYLLSEVVNKVNASDTTLLLWSGVLLLVLLLATYIIAKEENRA